MSFDKPKVTIDLDEYLSLKERLAQVEGSEMVVMAKKAIYEMVNNRGQIEVVASILRKDGIYIAHQQYSTKPPSYEDIIIKKINPEK